MQRACDIVLFTLVDVLTIGDGHKRFVGDVLEGFGATDVARIRVDLEQWLDFRNSRNDATNCDKVSKM